MVTILTGGTDHKLHSLPELHTPPTLRHITLTSWRMMRRSLVLYKTTWSMADQGGVKIRNTLNTELCHQITCQILVLRGKYQTMSFFGGGDGGVTDKDLTLPYSVQNSVNFKRNIESHDLFRIQHHCGSIKLSITFYFPAILTYGLIMNFGGWPFSSFALPFPINSVLQHRKEE